MLLKKFLVGILVALSVLIVINLMVAVSNGIVELYNHGSFNSASWVCGWISFILMDKPLSRLTRFINKKCGLPKKNWFWV
jgi:hypothetical protein